MSPAPSRPKKDRSRARGEAPLEITVTFRHVPPTSALKGYAAEKLERVKKYLHRPLDAHVILSVAKERHVAEITLKADHVTMFAAEETHDLYSAIDLAVDKLEHQAQKLHGKRGHHKGALPVRGVSEVTTSVLAGDRGGPGAAREVIRTQRVSAKPLAIEDAVEQLAASGDEFLVFTNASNQRLAVLYRRRDGNYGLIEPEGR
jgi:putative sigma-54 modulation protein